MQNKTTDYLKIVDLNPAAGTIFDPRVDGALCDFEFAAESQHLFLPAFGGGNPVRILYSFDSDHLQGGVPPLPSLPVPGAITVHGLLLSIGGPPPTMEARYENSHTRRSVRLWIDPATPPQAGQVVQVVVKAWASAA